jgi:general secretion pathway protein N
MKRSISLFIAASLAGAAWALAHRPLIGPEDRSINAHSTLNDPHEFTSSVDGGAPKPGVLQPDAAAEKTGNPLWNIPVSSLSATRDRPIFSPSRRPPPPILNVSTQRPRPVSSGTPNRPSLSLVGIIAGESDSIAIFLDEQTKTVIRLRAGESHSGWALQLVQAKQAVLSRGHQSTTLTLPSGAAK